MANAVHQRAAAIAGRYWTRQRHGRPCRGTAPASRPASGRRPVDFSPSARKIAGYQYSVRPSSGIRVLIADERLWVSLIVGLRSAVNQQTQGLDRLENGAAAPAGPGSGPRLVSPGADRRETRMAADRPRWLLIAFIALSQFASAFMHAIVGVPLPTMAREFRRERPGAQPPRHGVSRRRGRAAHAHRPVRRRDRQELALQMGAGGARHRHLRDRPATHHGAGHRLPLPAGGGGGRS